MAGVQKVFPRRQPMRFLYAQNWLRFLLGDGTQKGYRPQTIEGTAGAGFKAQDNNLISYFSVVDIVFALKFLHQKSSILYNCSGLYANQHIL